MPTIIDSLLVTLDSKADASGFDKFQKGFDDLFKNTGRAGQGFSNLRQSVDNLGGSRGPGILDAIMGRLVVTVGDVAHMLEFGARALHKFFEPALEADQINAKIAAFGYDVADVRKQLMDMSLNMGTPFKDAIEGFTKLKSYGVDPLNGSLNDLKTIASVSGGSLERMIVAYGQAMAMGSLQGQEKNQFINAGVDVWGALKRFTGKELGELQDMMRDKKITADILSSALHAEAKRLKPAADAIARSMKAQFTNLSSLVYNFISQMASSRLWKSATDGMIDFVDAMKKVLSVESAKNFFNELDHIVITMVERFKNLYNAVTDNFPVMVTLSAIIMSYVLPAITALMGRIISLSAAILTNPLTWIIIAIGSLVAVLADLDDAANGKKTLFDWSPQVVETYKIIKQYILAIADMIQSVIDGRAWANLRKGWDDLVIKIKQDIASIKADLMGLVPDWIKSLMSDSDKFNAAHPDSQFTNIPGNMAGPNFAAMRGVTGPTSNTPTEPSGPSLWDKLSDWSSKAFNPITGELTPGGMAARQALRSANNNVTNNSTSSPVIDNSVHVTATISGVENPQQVGAEVKSQVDQAKRDNATVQANSKGAIVQ